MQNSPHGPWGSMKNMLRTALFLAAAVSTTQVAPAKTGTELEPVAMEGSALLPATVATDILLDSPVTDPVEIDTVALLADEALEEAADAVPVTLSLGELVAQYAGTSPRDAQMECLARAVYFEARGETLEGQLAVAEVIANRADSARWPSSYCGVVKQRSQFSFVKGGRIPEPRRSSGAWKRAVAIARIVDGEHHESTVSNALFFHARYVNPGWRLKRVGTVGNHVFYQ